MARRLQGFGSTDGEIRETVRRDGEEPSDRIARCSESPTSGDRLGRRTGFEYKRSQTMTIDDVLRENLCDES